MFSEEVASRITTTDPFVGAVSNSSAKFFEHAANISLWALNTVPEMIEKFRVLYILLIYYDYYS